MPLTLSGTSGVLDNSGAFVAGTAVNSTSGTSIDFTGIPSWVKRITVMLNVVSTNGASLIQVQLGDSGGVETTGYNGYYWASLQYRGAFVSGAIISGYNDANSTLFGQVFINRLNGNMWSITGITSDPVSFLFGTSCAGTKELSATLDRVRITAVNGTDVFDGGTINILYE